MKRKVYLVDGSGYIFRAFYAVAPLKTKEGFPTNALYGYTRMLLKLLNEADSQHVVVVFDAGKDTFRTELYSDYKANRKECPEDLVSQMPFFREISSALGLTILEKQGFEADDIIGTLVKRLALADIECVVVSGDKDLMQLVGDNISIWDTMRDHHYGPNEVKAKMGVGPERIVDLLGIMGDSSDNIPGLKGAGPKTAVQLIEKYGDIESIINSVKLISDDAEIRNRKKISQQIEADSDILRLSRKLAEIDINVPIELKVADRTQDGEGCINMSLLSISDEQLYQTLERRDPISDRLQSLIDKFEFSSLVKDFKIELPSSKSIVKENYSYKTVLDRDFADWLVKLKQQESFAIDLETTSLDVLKAEIIGASFCWSEQEAFYIPLAHLNPASGEDQVSIDRFIEESRALLEDLEIKKIGQNIKYDIEVLSRYDVNVRGLYFDTMIAAYLINPDRRSYNLTALSKDYLGRDVIEFDEILNGAESFAHVPIINATRYACQDAHLAWVLCTKLGESIREMNLSEVFHSIEMPLVAVLKEMELKGIKLDTALLENLSLEFSTELENLKVQLHEMAGGEFNLNSPKQLADILFNKLGISQKGLKKTKTGVSTDSSVLEKLANEHPLPALILRYRTLHKLKSTYVDSLPTQISSVTKRLHTKFNQTQTGTGRLSSSEPNLQNIPIQTSEGSRIRQAFIAEEGKTFISADYSQIELRILAHISGDENLRSAFLEDQDIHSKTAREIMNLPEDEPITSDLRRIGKTINFGVIYGMSGFRLGRELGIPVSVANQYIDGYFNRYPKVQELFARLEQEALNKGYVTTIFGRRRIIGDLDTAGRDKGFAVRAAINAPMQGTAADLIKLAMIRIQSNIEERKLPISMLLQIHDELLFECSAGNIEEMRLFIVDIMEKVTELTVPLRVDTGVGKNWQDAHS